MLRRSVAVLLGVLVFLTLGGAIYLWHVKTTVLNPGYVTKQLRDQKVYDFVYQDVIPTEVRYRIQNPPDFLGSDLQRIQLNPTTDAPAVVGLVTDLVPQALVQQQTETAIDQMLPYVTGASSSFAITPNLSSQVLAVPSILKKRLPELRFGQRVDDAILAPRIQTALNSLGSTGLQIQVTDAQAKTLAGEIAPSTWIESQLVQASGPITQWLTKKQDHFTVRVKYSTQVQDAAAAIKQVLANSGTEAFLFNQVIEPEVQKSVQQLNLFNGQITITNQDVETALHQVAPSSWIQAQLDQVINTLASYVSGQSNDLSVTVNLADRRPAAATAIKSLADAKLKQVVDSRPVCQNNQQILLAAQQVANSQLPDCLPPNIDRATLVSLLTPFVNQQIDQQIVPQIPDSITFTRQDLVSMVGPQAIDQIDQVRTWIVQGFTYTDADLMSKLQSNQSGPTPSDIQHVRDFLSGGYTFTPVQLQEWMSADQWAQLQRTRSDLRTFRTWWWLSFLIPLLLLIGIAFLGGRRWSSRFLWASGTLTICALLLWLVFGPIWKVNGAHRLSDQLQQSAQDINAVERPLAEQAAAKGASVLNGWIGGYASKAGIILIIGVLATAGAAAWFYTETRAELAYPGAEPPQPPAESHTEASPPPPPREPESPPPSGEEARSGEPSASSEEDSSDESDDD